MATQRDGQRWILDALISVGGWDILHPEVGPFFQQLGYNPGDIQGTGEPLWWNPPG